LKFKADDKVTKIKLKGEFQLITKVKEEKKVVKKEEVKIAPAPARATRTRIDHTRRLAPRVTTIGESNSQVGVVDTWSSKIKAKPLELRKTGLDEVEHPTLEVGLILDCTGSMGSWMKRA